MNDNMEQEYVIKLKVFGKGFLVRVHAATLSEAKQKVFELVQERTEIVDIDITDEAKEEIGELVKEFFERLAKK